MHINGKYQRNKHYNKKKYYFFDDMINIENFNPDLLKIDKKSYKNIGIYYIGYITMKNSDYVKIKSVNPLFIIVDEKMDLLKKKMEINT